MALKRTPTKAPTVRIDEAWDEIEDLVSNAVNPFDLKKSDDVRTALDLLARIKTAVEAAIASGAVAPAPAGAPAQATPVAPATVVTPTGSTPLAPPPLPATRPAATGGFRLSFGKKTTAPAGAPATP